jgi:hypothetical protein
VCLGVCVLGLRFRYRVYVCVEGKSIFLLSVYLSVAVNTLVLLCMIGCPELCDSTGESVSVLTVSLCRL